MYDDTRREYILAVSARGFPHIVHLGEMNSYPWFSVVDQ
jgi:hypothetical protein